MNEAVGAVLAFAVGVGISPIPIVAVILVLFSERAKVNGPLFLIGWLVGLTGLFVGFFLLADALDLSSDRDTQDRVSWLRLTLGLMLVVAAVRKLRTHPDRDAEPMMPGWMTRLDHIVPSRALGLGALLSLNPKNLVLGAGAATGLAQLGATTAEVVVATIGFVAIGSVVSCVAVVYYLIGGERARARLDTMKSWLTLHNSAVMAVLFLVFGALLVSQGLGLRSSPA